MKPRRNEEVRDLADAMTLDHTALADAPLAAVLLRGLTLAGDDPLDGVLASLRAELEAAARACEAAGQVTTANVLDGFRRRLEVAIELHRRASPRRGRR